MNIIILDDDILFLNTFKNKIQHFAKKIFINGEFLWLFIFQQQETVNM